MGGSETEVGHPNSKSLYRESNLRGFLVGCPGIGEEWPTPRAGRGVNDKGLTLIGNVIGYGHRVGYRLTLSESGQGKAPEPIGRRGDRARLGYGKRSHVHKSSHRMARASMPSRRGVTQPPQSRFPGTPGAPRGD